MPRSGSAISKARREILAAFDEMQVGSDLLRQFIAEAENAHPGILEPYVTDASCPPVEPARLRWDTGYYSRQKLCAGINFSRTRLEHLIEVRDFFRQQQYKGFSPQPLTDRAPDMGKTSPAGRPTSGTSNFRPSDNLKKFVDEGDVPTIRSALRLELNNNRLSRQDLLDAMTWVKARAGAAFDPYVEKAFAGAIDPDPAQWTPDYYDTQTVYLKTNFSTERFQHLIDVRIHLRERGAEGFVATPQPQGGNAPATRPGPSQSPPRQSASEPEARQQPDELNSVFRLALLIGGALAAAVIYLTLAR